MFCTGEAPTVPGISARFSSPGKPCSSVQSTKSCQFSPAPASTIVARGPSSTSRRPGHLDLEHQRLDVAREHDVAAAPQHELGDRAVFGVGQQLLHLGFAAHPHQRPGLGDDAEGVVRLQGYVLLHDHGRIVASRPSATGEIACRHSTQSASRTWWRCKNAVDNAAKEIGTRFDFKGTSAGIELKDKEITHVRRRRVPAHQVEDILTNKLTKRSVDVRFLDKGDVQKIGGDKVKQVLKVRNGIETEQAKKITRLIKDSKLKVQAAIQGDAVRITGAKRDDLQAAMALIRKEITDVPLSFNNFSD